MKKSSNRILFWTPRILVILFAIFISLFALDVFGESNSLGKTIIALLIHLIPTVVILAFLAILWRRPWLAAALFWTLGFVYLAMTRGRMHWSAYLLISGPLFLIGFLYLADWLSSRRLPAEN